MGYKRSPYSLSILFFLGLYIISLLYVFYIFGEVLYFLSVGPALWLLSIYVFRLSSLPGLSRWRGLILTVNGIVYMFATYISWLFLTKLLQIFVPSPLEAGYAAIVSIVIVFTISFYAGFKVVATGYPPVKDRES